MTAALPSSTMRAPPTRSLTSAYMQYRSLNKKSKQGGRPGTESGSNGQDPGHHQRLLGPAEQDNGASETEMAYLPPQWVDLVDEANDDISKIREKLVQLQRAQQKRLLKVFREDDGPDREIELISSSVGQFFRQCEARIQQIQYVGGNSGISDRENILRKNVQRRLATQLQQLSMQLRKVQKTYLAELPSRWSSARTRGPGRSRRSWSPSTNCTRSSRIWRRW